MKKHEHIKENISSLDVGQTLLAEIKPIGGGKLHALFIDVYERSEPSGASERVGIDLTAEANAGDSRFNRNQYVWHWQSFTPEGFRNIFPKHSSKLDHMLKEEDVTPILEVNPYGSYQGESLRLRVSITDTHVARSDDFDPMGTGEPRYTQSLKRNPDTGEYFVVKKKHEDSHIKLGIFRKTRFVGLTEEQVKLGAKVHQIIKHTDVSKQPPYVEFNGSYVNLANAEMIDLSEAPEGEAPSVEASPETVAQKEGTQVNA